MLAKRIQEITEEYERNNIAERIRLERTIALLEGKVAALKTVSESDKLRGKRQNELIDALQQQVRDWQRVEGLRSKERLLEQGKLLKQVESLRSEVMALRFQLLCCMNTDGTSNDSLHGLEQSESVSEGKYDNENCNPNTTSSTISGEDHFEKRFKSANSGLMHNMPHVPYAEQLHNAARIGALTKVRSLLNPEEDLLISSLNSYRKTISMTLMQVAGSVVHPHTEEMVSMLVSHGASPFEEDDKSGWNSIHQASYSGNETVLKTLLSLCSAELSTNLENLTKRNETALHVAASQNNAGCVRLLLRAGADVTSLDAFGRSAEVLVTENIRKNDIDSPIPTGMSVEDEALVRSAENHVREEAKSTLAVLRDPQNLFWSHSTRANRLYSSEDYEGARLAYAIAISTAEDQRNGSVTNDYNRATLYYNIARASAKVSRHLEAVKACNTAIELRGGNYTNALAQRASSYMSLFDYAHAVQNYEMLLNQRRNGSADADKDSSLTPEDWTVFLDRARELAAKACDHYLVLGVPQDADQTAVKKAFRKQCLRWHPDKHRENEDDAARASVMFKAINEANEVLSDAQKRTLYDIDRISEKMDDMVRRRKEEQKNWSSSKKSRSRYSDLSTNSSRRKEGFTAAENFPGTFVFSERGYPNDVSSNTKSCGEDKSSKRASQETANPSHSSFSDNSSKSQKSAYTSPLAHANGTDPHSRNRYRKSAGKFDSYDSNLGVEYEKDYGREVHDADIDSSEIPHSREWERSNLSAGMGVSIFSDSVESFDEADEDLEDPDAYCYNDA